MREEQSPPPGPPPAQRRPAGLLHSLRWPLVVVVLGVLAYFGYRETLDRLEGMGRAVGGAAAERVERLAESFLTADVNEIFLSYLPEVTSTRGGNLELATLRLNEVLTRTDERRVFWDQVYLGTNVTEIRVPVTFRYHLRLHDPWRLEVSDQTCVVHAPRIRATQPPAIHTSGMQRRLEEGWLRFDAEDQLAELESGLTARLEQLAEDRRHLALVREECRRTVGEFVRDWLLREDQWRSDRLRTIRVVFPDEPQEASGESDVTLRLEGPVG